MRRVSRAREGSFHSVVSVRLRSRCRSRARETSRRNAECSCRSVPQGECHSRGGKRLRGTTAQISHTGRRLTLRTRPTRPKRPAERRRPGVVSRGLLTSPRAFTANRGARARFSHRDRSDRRVRTVHLCTASTSCGYTVFASRLTGVSVRTRAPTRAMHPGLHRTHTALSAHRVLAVAAPNASLIGTGRPTL